MPVWKPVASNAVRRKLLWDKQTQHIHDRITVDTAICHGKPCIRGLRYPVETVLEWLADGMSIDEILADYEDRSGKIFPLFSGLPHGLRM